MVTIKSSARAAQQCGKSTGFMDQETQGLVLAVTFMWPREFETVT